MPCYTQIKIEVKDKSAAEAALKQLNIKAQITQSANKKTWIIIPENPPLNFQNKFNEEYGIIIATRKARQEGYTVSKTVENDETVLYLRSYT